MQTPARTVTTTSSSSSSNAATTKISAMFKVAMYGPSGAGKSMLHARIPVIGDSNSGPEPPQSLLPRVSTEPTIGGDFRSYEYTRDAEHFRLQLWDTGGQERFLSIATSYLRNCIAILVTFDLYELYVQLCDTRTSLPPLSDDALAAALHDKCKMWLGATRTDSITSSSSYATAFTTMTGGSGVLVMLVANKMDLCARFGASAKLTRLRDAMRKLAAQYNAEYFEVSALTGVGVRALLDRLLSSLHAVYLDNKRLQPQDSSAMRINSAAAVATTAASSSTGGIVSLTAATAATAELDTVGNTTCAC